MQTKYIPAVVGDTMIAALKWIGKFKDSDIAFDTKEKAIEWLKNNGHSDKKIV